MYRKEIGQLLNDLAWLDDVSYYHSLRTGYYMSLFAEVEVGKQFIKQAWVTRNEFVATGLLHDIVKVRWPREILMASERLQDLERDRVLLTWSYIIEHPLGSEEIIMDYYKKTGNRFWERIAQGVAAHHENYAGDGYPLRLKGSEIPLLARGLRIFDYFAASTEVRRHSKHPQNLQDVITYMRKCLGTHYEPYWGEKIIDFLAGAEPPRNLDHWLEGELKNFF